MTWRCALVAAVGMILGGTLARADIAPRPAPRPTPPATVPITIKVDDNARQPTLIISGSALNQAGLRGRGALDGTEERPQFHLVVAGVALALALSCGGLWLVRRTRGPGKRALMLLAGAGLLTAAASLTANPPPPPRPPADTRPVLFDGKIQVVVEGGGDGVQLIATKEMVEEILKSAKK